MSSCLQETISEKIIRLFGFTIATYCQRTEQSHLISTFPSIIGGKNILKWRLFHSKSLQYFIKNNAIKTFLNTFDIEQLDDEKTNDNPHQPHSIDLDQDEYSPVSLTTLNLNGFDINKLKEIYDIIKTDKNIKFEEFKSLIAMIIIDQFYKQKFKDKNYFNREAVNDPIDINLGSIEDIRYKLDHLKIDNDERCFIFNVFNDPNEKFDFMLKQIKTMNNEHDLNWFESEVINMKYLNPRNSCFFHEIAEKFKNTKNQRLLKEFIASLNILFLSSMDLFKEWMVFHSEEAYLSEIASKSFMTMDIIIIAINPNWNKMVMVQGILTKIDLTCCPCITL